MERADEITEIILTLKPRFSPIGSFEKIFPNSKKNGVPGGCGTCNETDAAINSPQSQKETDGCTVINSTMKEIIKTIPAITLFSRLKFIITSNLE